MSNIENIYRLTPLQEGLLFHALHAPDSGAYIVQTQLDLEGRLEVDDFRASFDQLIARHDVLRTAIFHAGIKKPRQVVLKERESEVSFFDLRNEPAGRRDERVAELIRADRARGFDLANDILIRAQLMQLTDDTFTLLVTHHHIIMDGWCMGLVFRELVELYAGLRRGAPARLGSVHPYSNYIRWLDRQDRDSAMRHWAACLEAHEAVASVPTDTIRRADGRGGAYVPKFKALAIGADALGRLEELRKRWGVTLNSIFQGVWGVLLRCYNNADDVTFGCVVSGRPAAVEGVETMIGLFINTVPVRIRTAPGALFRELVQDIQRGYVESEKHSYVSLSDIRAAAPGRSQLFDHIYVFENYPVDAALAQGASDDLGFRVVRSRGIEQSTYDFNVLVTRGEELTVRFAYNAGAFTDESVDRIAGHFRQALEAVLRDPEVAAAGIEIVTERERQELLRDFNDTAADYPREETLDGLFARQVARTPDLPAVVCNGERLSYRELDRRSEAVALALQEKWSPDERPIVAVMLDRSPDLVAALLGIIKAGGAYVPIDPAAPRERVRHVLAECAVNVLIAAPGSAGDPDYAGTRLHMGDFAPAGDRRCVRRHRATDLMYVIYTSGSTGTPKGVMVEHRGFVNQMTLLVAGHGFREGMQHALIVPPVFDPSVQSIFLPLVSGGTLHVLDQATIQTPARLIGYLREHRIDVTTAVTSFYELILAQEGAADVKLQIVLAGGDVFTPALYDQIGRTFRPDQIVNCYGPTETVINATLFPCRDVRRYARIPIGKPVANYRAYVLNRDLRLQPVGVTGELHIAGDGLARGYVGMPDATREKFVPCPFEPGRLMYRTGDLARWLPDGNLDFMGRADAQVKIRGHRVELGEIERALLQREGVAEAVVIACEAPAGGKRLHAYFVGRSDLTAKDLREHLCERVPEYMLPARFSRVDAIPLTTNGKVDREALASREVAVGTGAEYVAPATEAERIIAQVWAEALQAGQVGLNDNFFDLGGHSVTLIQIHGKLQERFKREIAITDLFKYPTVELLARFLGTPSASAASAEAPDRIEARTTRKTTMRSQRALRQELRQG